MHRRSKFCAYRFHLGLVISHIGYVCVIRNASHMSKTITKTLHGSPVSLYEVGFLFPELTAEFLAFDRRAQQAHFATLFVCECTYGTCATFCLSYYISFNCRDIHLHVPQSLFPSSYIVYFYKGISSVNPKMEIYIYISPNFLTHSFKATSAHVSSEAIKVQGQYATAPAIHKTWSEQQMKAYLKSFSLPEKKNEQ